MKCFRSVFILYKHLLTFIYTIQYLLNLVMLILAPLHFCTVSFKDVLNVNLKRLYEFCRLPVNMKL